VPTFTELIFTCRFSRKSQLLRCHLHRMVLKL
jgi:hypothetical protein